MAKVFDCGPKAVFESVASQVMCFLLLPLGGQALPKYLCLYSLLGRWKGGGGDWGVGGGGGGWSRVL